MVTEAVFEKNQTIKKVDLSVVSTVLRAGWKDFRAAPTHLYFLVLIYPIVMLVGVWAALNDNLIPLVFPIVSGAALLGPFSAIALYEMSRQRGAGRRVTWWQALRLVAARAAPAIGLLALALAVTFVLWLWVGLLLYRDLLGVAEDPSLGGFLGEVFSTSAGWTLILVGNAVGLLFAVVVLAGFVVSFQVVIDRNAGPLEAVVTSLRVFTVNPVTVVAWGLTIALLLAATVVTLFVGLAVVLPLLGHASWHFYCRTVGAVSAAD
ncbi:MAG: DUF2189 domain-containing protein [Rhodospirillales bacterium]